MDRSITFVQLPLVTKPLLEDEESRYYAAFWRQMERIFGVSFPQGEVYTIPEFPLWVTALSNATREAGWEGRFVDFARHTGQKSRIPLDAMVDELASDPSRCYAFSPFTNNYSISVALTRLFRQRADPEAVFLAGGAHATALPEDCIRDGYDYVVTGKGEDSLIGILGHLAGQSTPALDTVPGVAYRDGTGVRINPTARDRTYRHFNQLPDYRLIPPDYQVHFGRVYASLGCPYGCSFCADTIWIRMKPYFKDVAVVVEEIRSIRERYGVDLFFFGDEVFTLQAKYVEKLCDALRGEDIRWFCQTRANLIDPPMMKLLARSGCRLIQIGAESADEAVLQHLAKEVTFERIEDACAAAKDAGLNVLTYWMVGGPGETRRSAHKTMDCIDSLFRRRLTDLADYYICTPYQGTGLYQYPERYNVTIIAKSTDDWREDQPSVMRTEELDEYAIFDLWKQGLKMIAENMDRSRVPDEPGPVGKHRG